MKAHRIAYTKIDIAAMEESTGGQFNPIAEIPVKGADLLAEFAGRACYQSWSRPNPATARNADYIRSAVHEKKHESITAHASVTYYITGISRSLTHELIRHRWLAFSELSQRYVDMEDVEIITPPAVEAEGLHRPMDLAVQWAKSSYDVLVYDLLERGYTRKQAREAARAVLPSAVETRIVVTGNLRAWRDFIRQRWSVHADAEIQELAGILLEDLRKIAPNTFADIPEEPYS